MVEFHKLCRIAWSKLSQRKCLIYFIVTVTFMKHCVSRHRRLTVSRRVIINYTAWWKIGVNNLLKAFTQQCQAESLIRRLSIVKSDGMSLRRLNRAKIKPLFVIRHVSWCAYCRHTKDLPRVISNSCWCDDVNYGYCGRWNKANV